MEEYTINHIRTVLLVTLSILVIIILYYKLLQYMKKDMDRRSYPVLLPFKLSDQKLLVSIELPRNAEVSLEILDVEYNSVRSLIQGEQALGEVSYEVDMEDLPVEAAFVRLSSEGHQVLRRIEV